MGYDLEVRADPEYSRSVSLAEAREVIAALPGVTQIAPTTFVFDRRDAGIYFTLDLCDMSEAGASDGEPVTVNAIGISAPHGPAVPLAVDAGGEVAAMLGWQVYDEASGAPVLSPGKVSGAGDRLRHAASDAPTLGQLFLLEMWNHSLPAVATCLVVAALGTGAVVLQVGVAERAIGGSMAWGVAVGGVGLMLVKALVQAFLLRRNRSRSH